MLNIQKNLTNTFYALLALPATAMGFALAVQIAALSWILRTEFGLEIYEIGIVWATGPIAGIFGQVIVGVVSDNVWLWNGRRRPFILIGGTLAALMLLSLPNIDAIAGGIGFANIFFVAILVSLTLDVSINVSFNPTRSLIADVTPEGRPRTKGYTWMQTISGFFGTSVYVVGATLGNYFLIYSGAIVVLLFSIIPPLLIEEPRQLKEDDDDRSNYKDPLLAATISILIPGSGHLYARDYFRSGIFFVIAVFAYSVAILQHSEILWMIPFYIIGGVTHIASIVDAFRRVGFINRQDPELKKVLDDDDTDWPEIFKLLTAHGFSWLGVQSMFVYLIFFLEDQLVPLGHENTGQMINISFGLLNAVGFILPVLVYEPLAAKFGRVRIHFLAMATMALAYFGMSFLVTHPMILYALMAFAGIGWGAVVSLPFAILSENVNKNRMGFFMGVFNLSVVIPHLIVSLVFGFIIETFPTQNLLFVLCGVMLTLSTIAWAFVKETQKGEVDLDIPILPEMDDNDDKKSDK